MTIIKKTEVSFDEKCPRKDCNCSVLTRFKTGSIVTAIECPECKEVFYAELNGNGSVCAYRDNKGEPLLPRKIPLQETSQKEAKD